MKFPILVSLHCVFLLLVACTKESASTQDYMQQATKYVGEHNYRAAVISLKNAIQMEPQLASARYELGDVYLTIGDGISAEKELLLARDFGFNNATLEIKLQQARLWQNKFADVLALTAIAKEFSPESQSQLHSGRVLAAVAIGKLAQAHAELNLAQALATNSSTRFAKANVLLIEGKTDAAKSELTALLTQDKEHYAAWLEQGRILVKENALVDAEKAFRLVWEAGQDKTISPLRLKAALNLIQVSLMQNNIDAAKAILEDLKTALPTQPIVKYFVALIQYRDKDYEAARSNLLEVVNVAKEYLPAQLLLGATFYALGSFEQADVHLSRFVSRVPSHIQARKLLAATRMRQNRPSEVIDVLEPMLKDNTGDQQLLAMIGKAAISSGAVDKGTDYLERAVSADPENTLLRTELASAYLNQGDLDLAVKELESIPDKDANRRDSLLIAAALRAGDVQKAKAIAAQLLLREPSAAVLTMVGGVELVAGERLAAITYFDKALALSPDFIPAMNYLAQLAIEDSDLVRARTLLDKIVQIEPTHLVALLSIAQLTEQQGGTQEQTLEWVEKAHRSQPTAIQPVIVLTRYYLKKEQPDRALEIAKAYAVSTLESPEALLLFAQTQLAAGQAQAALNTADKYLKNQPNLVPGHLARAKIQMELGNDFEVRSSLQKALALQPDNLEATLVLAKLELSRKNYPATTALAEGLNKTHKTHNLGFQLLGDVWAHQGQWAKALGYYQKAAKVNLDFEVLLKLASTHGKLQQNKEALTLLSEWKVKHPDDAAIDLMISQFQSRSGDATAALKSLEQTVAKQPNNAAAWNNLAWSYFEFGDAKALDAARKAHQLQPKMPEIIDTYAWILLSTGGDKNTALALLREASQLAPTAVEIEYHLAEALIQNGEIAPGKAILQKIVKSGPEFASLEKAKQRLKGL